MDEPGPEKLLDEALALVAERLQHFEKAHYAELQLANNNDQ